MKQPMSMRDVWAAQEEAYASVPQTEPPTIGELIEALKEDYPDLQVPADLLLDAVVTGFSVRTEDDQGPVATIVMPGRPS